MTTLPHSIDLPTAKLAASFSNASATSKFYWLLAIIELAELGETHVKKRAIFSRMIANARYTVNYYRISFGKQDLIQSAIINILEAEKLTIDIKKSELLIILDGFCRRGCGDDWSIR